MPDRLIHSHGGLWLGLEPDLEILLHSYSSSKCWLGYTQAPQFAAIPVHIATILPELIMLGTTPDLLTSLTLIQGESKSAESLSRLRELVDAGWVRSLSLEDWERAARTRGLDPWAEERVERELVGEFRVTCTDLKAATFALALTGLIEELSTTFNLMGCMFLHWPERGIVIYPHEESGIGFFAAPRAQVVAEAILRRLPGAQLPRGKPVFRIGRDQPSS